LFSGAEGFEEEEDVINIRCENVVKNKGNREMLP
jgi:hypothetical protein